jgi:putative FmdB family regulatory protein
MPIHEYRCNICHRIFEIITFRSEEAGASICVYCKSPQIMKIISAPVVEFQKWPIKKRRLPPELKKYNT